MPTPTELAVEIRGRDENWARSPGARKVRQVARELFPESAPGHGGEWDLSDDQAGRIRESLRGERLVSPSR
jgi:hypothetical protein